MGRDSENVKSEMNFEEKLINAIQKNVCLYNKHCVTYRKRTLKQKAWSGVASEIGSNVKECQHRWRSLRDRFVREIRSNSNCKWRYMAPLKFLIPHLDPRNTSQGDVMTDEESCSNSEPYTKTEYEENKKYLEEVSEILPIKFEGKSEIEEVQVDDSEPEDLPFVSFPSGSNSTETITKSDVKRRRLNSEDSNNRLGMVSLSELKCAEIESTPKSRNEDYYKTLDSYMLQLPVSLQDDLKIEILNRVYCETKKHSTY